MSLELWSNFNLKIISLMVVLIASLQARANDQDTRPAELEFANKNLNAVYKEILNKLKPSNKIKLIKAQRHWIVFRDQDCTWAFSAEPLDCLIERTDNRVKELKSTYFFDSKGNYITVDN